MSKPKLEKVYALAAMFQSVAEATRNKALVNMGETQVPSTDDCDDICGTPACHAGWFAVIHKPAEQRGTHYTEGAEAMASFLGMGSRNMLENWAKLNRDIWGNEWGGYIFSDSRAFNPRSDKPITMKDIADHWYGVAKRLESYPEMVKERNRIANEFAERREQLREEERKAFQEFNNKYQINKEV